MSGRTRRLAAAAAFAACVSLPLFSPASTANADTCLTAPKGPGPKGSRWYYRVEWPAQRKCWHLVLNDKRQKTALKAAPQADADDDTEATPAPAANIAPVRTAESQQAKPVPAPAPVAPRVQTLITRNASNTDETAPWPDPPANAAPRADEQTPAAAERRESASAAMPATPVSQPIAASEAANASAPDGGMTWRLLFAAIALLGSAGAAVLVVMDVMRRRRDVLNTALAADAAPEDWRDEGPVEDAPTFAPLPPIGMARDDDVEEAVRRFVQSSRRRAA
jgi:hypothetical protein